MSADRTVEEAPPEQHRMAGAPGLGHGADDGAALGRVEGRDQPIEVVRVQGNRIIVRACETDAESPNVAPPSVDLSK